jgi:hypothetical protein
MPLLCCHILLLCHAQDHRLLFLLGRQEFVELLRSATAEGDARALGAYSWHELASLQGRPSITPGHRGRGEQRTSGVRGGTRLIHSRKPQASALGGPLGRPARLPAHPSSAWMLS